MQVFPHNADDKGLHCNKIFEVSWNDTSQGQLDALSRPTSSSYHNWQSESSFMRSLRRMCDLPVEIISKEEDE